MGVEYDSIVLCTRESSIGSYTQNSGGYAIISIRNGGGNSGLVSTWVDFLSRRTDIQFQHYRSEGDINSATRALNEAVDSILARTFPDLEL